jgi:hypothetical protein
MNTIDITPTWREALNICLAVLENGTAEGRKIAMGELTRMAEIADRAVARTKAAEQDECKLVIRTNFQRATEAQRLCDLMKEMTGVDDLPDQVSDALCHLMHLCRLIRDEEGNDIDFDECLTAARINFDAEAEEDPDN